MYDYSKLLGRIKECGYTQEIFARALRISASTLNLKLNNNAFFKQSEIKTMCKVLNISKEDVGLYFFTEKV